MGSPRARRSTREWRTLADVVIQAETAQRSPIRRVVAALTLAGILLVANAAFIMSGDPQATPLFANLNPFETATRQTDREEPPRSSRLVEHHSAPLNRTRLIDHQPYPAAHGYAPYYAPYYRYY